MIDPKEYERLQAEWLKRTGVKEGSRVVIADHSAREKYWTEIDGTFSSTPQEFKADAARFKSGIGIVTNIRATQAYDRCNACIFVRPKYGQEDYCFPFYALIPVED